MKECNIKTSKERVLVFGKTFAILLGVITALLFAATILLAILVHLVAGLIICGTLIIGILIYMFFVPWYLDLFPEKAEVRTLAGRLKTSHVLSDLVSIDIVVLSFNVYYCNTYFVLDFGGSKRKFELPAKITSFSETNKNASDFIAVVYRKTLFGILHRYTDIPITDKRPNKKV